MRRPGGPPWFKAELEPRLHPNYYSSVCVALFYPFRIFDLEMQTAPAVDCTRRKNERRPKAPLCVCILEEMVGGEGFEPPTPAV